MDAAFCDPARVNVLFSPFRSRALNLDHYDEKMRFWIRTIDEYTTCDKQICLTVADMERAFVAENQKAVCLQQVLTNLIRSGQAVRKDVFLSSLPSSKENSTWFSWSINQFQWVARKAWSYSPVSIYNTIERDTPVVYIPQLKLQEKLVHNVSSLQNKVMSLEEWKSEVTMRTGLVDELELLVEHLKASGKLVVDYIGHTEIVKLAVPTSNCSSSEITLVEKGQFDIRHTIQILERDLELLYEKQKHSENQARLALREGKRQTAKCHLRGRKMAEKRADKLITVLDNLTAISVQVDDAASDARILAAYESGKHMLDQVLEENGLTTDRISDAMLNVQDALDKQEEISTSLAQPLVDEDVAELERALEELLEEDRNVHEKNKAASERNAISEMEDSMPMDQDDQNLLQELNELSLTGLDDLNKTVRDSSMCSDTGMDVQAEAS